MSQRKLDWSDGFVIGSLIQVIEVRQGHLHVSLILSHPFLVHFSCAGRSSTTSINLILVSLNWYLQGQEGNWGAETQHFQRRATWRKEPGSYQNTTLCVWMPRSLCCSVQWWSDGEFQRYPKVCTLSKGCLAISEPNVLSQDLDSVLDKEGQYDRTGHTGNPWLTAIRWATLPRHRKKNTTALCTYDRCSVPRVTGSKLGCLATGMCLW